MTPTHAVRRAVTTVAVLLGVLGAQAPASAGIQGSAPRTQPVTSATFAVIPTTSGGTPAAGALTLTFGFVLPPPQYFDAVNTGNLDLTATSYGVAVSGGGGSPSITLTACSGAGWNTLLGTCVGTTTGLSSWTSASSAPVASAAAPTTAGSRLSIKATLTGVTTTTTTAVITTSVSSGGPRQVRAAGVTNT
jgi:hypothetical protein